MAKRRDSTATAQEKIGVKRLALASLIAPLMSCSQPAQLEVKNPWTRDTVGSVANAAIFMSITSPTEDRLVSASTPAARKTDLMTMGGGGNVMEMKYLQGIDLPANTPVSLNPTGLHVWLANLHRPLKAGETIPLTLRFEKAGDRQITVSVIAPSAPPPNSGG